MKLFTYILASLFTIIFIIGFTFKIMHFPGAVNLLFIGETGAGAICFPIILYIKIKEGQMENKQLLLQWILGQAALILFILSTWLHFVDDSWANIFMTVAFLLFAFGFLPILFKNLYKHSLTHI